MNPAVSQIADSLGFDEETNFVKFFKRDAGCTPAAFRRQQDFLARTDSTRSNARELKVTVAAP